MPLETFREMRGPYLFHAEMAVSIVWGNALVSDASKRPEVAVQETEFRLLDQHSTLSCP